MRVAVCALLVLLVPSALSSAGTARSSPANGPIILLTGGAIHSMNPDGTGDKQLTSRDRFYALSASASPDGRRIVFVGDIENDRNFDVYVMRIDGSEQARLTDDPATDSAPTWSPDGARIVFVSRRDGDEELYVMNADGTGLSRLTDNTVPDGIPSWSPDGRKIVFVRGLRDDSELYVMNADGGGASRLTDNEVLDAGPSWSPDGARIAFVRSGGGGGSDIYTVKPDGSGELRVSSIEGLSSEYDWSPDGTSIAFSDVRPLRASPLWVVRADGSERRQLTHPSDVYPFGFDSAPHWSPDGRFIAFNRDRSPHPTGPSVYVYPGEIALTYHASVADWAVVVPPPCRVPRVTRMRLRSARAAIKRAHCSVGRIRYRRSARPGRVVRQTPRAGTQLRNGARVNLVVGRRSKR